MQTIDKGMNSLNEHEQEMWKLTGAGHPGESGPARSEGVRWGGVLEPRRLLEGEQDCSWGQRGCSHTHPTAWGGSRGKRNPTSVSPRPLEPCSPSSNPLHPIATSQADAGDQGSPLLENIKGIDQGADAWVAYPERATVDTAQ